MFHLDHIAIASSSLAEGTTWVEEKLGVSMVPGGEHDRFGTHNTLLGLADGLYLEVIAKNPNAASTGRATWFGLDTFRGQPRLANWICAGKSLSHAPAVAGTPQSLTRGELKWDITVPDDGSLPDSGGFPTLIAWGDGVPHPSTVLPASGCRLVSWEVLHPEATRLRQIVPIDDDRVTFTTAQTAAFRATFDTPNGKKVLM